MKADIVTIQLLVKRTMNELEEGKIIRAYEVLKELLLYIKLTENKEEKNENT